MALGPEVQRQQPSEQPADPQEALKALKQDVTQNPSATPEVAAPTLQDAIKAHVDATGSTHERLANLMKGLPTPPAGMRLPEQKNQQV